MDRGAIRAAQLNPSDSTPVHPLVTSRHALGPRFIPSSTPHLPVPGCQRPAGPPSRLPTERPTARLNPRGRASVAAAVPTAPAGPRLGRGNSPKQQQPPEQPATIPSSRSSPQAIDAYNDAHHYRAENPLAHLHEDEARPTHFLRPSLGPRLPSFGYTRISLSAPRTRPHINRSRIHLKTP